MDQRVLGIDGWMAEEELDWLYETASKIPADGLIVELGSWFGRSSAALALGMLPSVRLVCIDTWLGTPTEPAHSIAQTIDIHAHFLANMDNLGVGVLPYERDRLGVQYLKMNSVDAAQFFNDASVDLIFIDGDHRKVGLDLDAWLPKMKPESIVSGHDYFCFYEFIQPQIHEQLTYIHEIHHSIWVRYFPVEKPGWY
jgi:predicted O-methyltransferase YrrM